MNAAETLSIILANINAAAEAFEATREQRAVLAHIEAGGRLAVYGDVGPLRALQAAASATAEGADVAKALAEYTTFLATEDGAAAYAALASV